MKRATWRSWCAVFLLCFVCALYSYLNIYVHKETREDYLRSQQRWFPAGTSLFCLYITLNHVNCYLF